MKATNNSRDFRRVMTYLFPFWKTVIAILVLSGVGVELNLVPPLLIRHLINSIGTHQQFPLIWVITGLFTIPVFSGLSSLFSRYLTFVVSQLVTVTLRKQLYKQASNQSKQHFPVSRGEMVSRIINDPAAVQDTLLHTVVATVIGFIAIITTMIYMFRLNIELAAIGCAFVPVQYILGWQIGRIRAKIAIRYQTTLAETTHFLQNEFEQSNGPRDADFEILATKLQKTMIHRSFLGQVVSTSTSVLTSWGPATIYTVGVIMVVHHEIRLGTVVAMTQYLSQLYAPAANMTGITAVFRGALAVYGRIFSFFDTETKVDSAK